MKIWSESDETPIFCQSSEFQFDLETVDEEPPRGNATANSLLLLVLLLVLLLLLLLVDRYTGSAKSYYELH